MNSKRVFKWIGCIVATIILTYITIMGIVIFLFVSGSDYQKGSIYLSELQNSGLYYSDEEHKIADDVVAVHEVNNKLYYITLSGIGIFDENVSFLDR